MKNTLELFKKISQNTELMKKFSKSKNFNDIHEICKHIDPTITKDQTENGLNSLIFSNMNSSTAHKLTSSELEQIAGGTSTFSKVKASALTALTIIGASAVLKNSSYLSGTVYAADSPEVSVSSKPNTNSTEQKTLNADLLTAIQKNDLSRCEELLNLGADINAPLHDGNTALMQSVLEGNVKLTEFFLSKKANINLKNLNGETALMNCVNYSLSYKPQAKETSEKIAALLLENGAQVNEQNHKGLTALDKAILAQNKSLTQLFHKNNANPDLKNNLGQTKLFENINIRKDLDKHTVVTESTIEKNKNILQMYLQYGADANTADSEETPALVWAAINSNTEATRLLLEFGANVNAQNKKGETALMYASASNNTAIMKLLIDKGADVNKQNLEGQSAAIYSIRYEKPNPAQGSIQFFNISEDALKLLVQHKANINTKDNSGETALTYALKRRYNLRHIKSLNYSSSYSLSSSPFQDPQSDLVIKFLIENGANINETESSKKSILHLAVESCATREITEMIIKKGANINAQDELGNTPSHIAAQLLWEKHLKECGSQYSPSSRFNEINKELNSFIEWNSQNLKTLTENGADINIKNNTGNTPLIYAAQNKNTKLLSILLEAKATVDIQNSEGETALMKACLSGDEESVKMLLNNNADVNLKDSQGRTALICSAIYGGNPEKIKLLLEKNADASVTDNEGKTALMHALTHPHGIVKETVKLLTDATPKIYEKDALVKAFARGADNDTLNAVLDKATDIDFTDDKGKTALMYAAEIKPEFIEALLKKGANINAKSLDGNTALMQACYHNNKKSVEFLLNNKANINEKNQLGLTALMQTFNKDISELLLNHGADINTIDNNGKTVLDHILEKGMNHCGEQGILEIEDLLIKNQNIKIDGKSETINNLLFLSVKNNHTSIIRTLIDKGADKDKTNSAGNPALIEAIDLSEKDTKYIYTVRLLLDMGANVNIKDVKGKTPIMHAVQNNKSQNFEVIKLLMEKSPDLTLKDEDNKTVFDYNKGSYVQAINDLLKNKN